MMSTNNVRCRALAAGVIAVTGTCIGAGGAAARGSAPQAAAAPEFCTAFAAVEQAFKEVPEDPAAIEAFVAERVTPELATIREHEPEAIAVELETMTSTVEQAISSGDLSLFETDEFSTASTTVYRSLEDNCGFPLVDVLGIDYAFGGVPQTLAPGPTTFLLTNGSQDGELHMMVIVKLQDGVDLTLDEILALPDDGGEQHVEVQGGDLFVYPDQTAGTVVNLTPGRWAYVCFVPVGMTPEVMEAEEASGTEPPEGDLHSMEGMAGEFTVE